MADKYLARVSGVTTQKTPATVGGSISAGKILALDSSGKIDQSVLPTGIGADVNIIPASEALSAGDFVNIYTNNGAANVRKADNSNGYVAHGYVDEAVASGADATVYPLDGTNSELTGLTSGAVYWLGTAGKATSTALDETDPGNANKVSQMLGIAVSATELRTDDYGYVIL